MGGIDGLIARACACGLPIAWTLIAGLPIPPTTMDGLIGCGNGGGAPTIIRGERARLTPGWGGDMGTPGGTGTPGPETCGTGPGYHIGPGMI